jgi:twitching motility protein PilT
VGVDSDVANLFDFELAAAQLADVDVICCDPISNPYTSMQLTEAATRGQLVIASVAASSAGDAVNAWTSVIDADARQHALRFTSRALQLVIHQTLVDRADGDGRVLACGVLLRTPAVYNLIREDRAHQLPAMMAVGAKWGMRTLEQDLESLVNGGLVNRDAALAAHPQPWTLRDWLDRSAPTTPPPPQP